MYLKLMYLRNGVKNKTEKYFKQKNYFQNTLIFLVNHELFNKFNSKVIMVDIIHNNKKRDLVFILKDKLVKNLDQYKLADKIDVTKQISKYVQKIVINSMRNKYHRISVENFTKKVIKYE